MIKTDVLIIGTGNIALKHASVICKLYPNLDISLYNYRNRVFNKQKKKDKEILSSFKHITNDHSKIQPCSYKSFAIIASPASLHTKHAVLFAKKNFHILCEKPLTSNMRYLRDLIKVLNRNNLSSHVGYNMRFLQSIIFLKKTIDKNLFGKILSSNISVCTDFTEWRPNKFYKETSTASKSLGGGVVNELSHEIDYMNYLFGQPLAQESVVYKSNKLKLEVNDVCNARFSYPGFKVNVYLDMLSSIEKRICYIQFENAKVLLNIKNNTIVIIENKGREKVYSFSKNMSNTYEDQIKYFIKKIKDKIINETDIVNYFTLTKNLLKINNISNG